MTIIAQPPGTPLRADWKVTYDGPIDYHTGFQIPTIFILIKVGINTNHFEVFEQETIQNSGICGMPILEVLMFLASI